MDEKDSFLLEKSRLLSFCFYWVEKRFFMRGERESFLLGGERIGTCSGGVTFYNRYHPFKGMRRAGLLLVLFLLNIDSYTSLPDGL